MAGGVKDLTAGRQAAAAAAAAAGLEWIRKEGERRESRISKLSA